MLCRLDHTKQFSTGKVFSRYEQLHARARAQLAQRKHYVVDTLINVTIRRRKTGEFLSILCAIVFS